VANTLAYYDTATITAVKSIILQAPGGENSTIRKFVNYGRKKAYNIGPGWTSLILFKSGLPRLIEAARDGRRNLDGVGKIGKKEIGQAEPHPSRKQRLNLAEIVLNFVVVAVPVN
jgi:hypothetical protein